MRLHNDEPTLLDQLERLDLVRRVGDDVATCDPPHVFGIHGDWGAGKTSFLHQLQAYMTGQCPQQPKDRLVKARDANPDFKARPSTDHVTVVWFEAWRYQNEQAPIVALLQEIRSQLPWHSKALAEGMKLGEVAVSASLLLFDDITKKIGVQSIAKVREAGEKWEQDHLATQLPAHLIRQHLEHALSQLLGDKPKKKGNLLPRLVVIVDDLDRCDAEAAYKLLEGIKIYLNLPNCVFVLGMNQRIIEGAIAKHLPQGGSDALRMLRAREYLEKICHSIEHLPVVQDPGTLLENYLDDLPGSAEICGVVRAFPCLPSNPRKIKSYANLLRRYVPSRLVGKLTVAQTAKRNTELAVIISCLYQFHPGLYRILEAHPQFYEQIRRWSLQDGTAMKHPAFEGLRESEQAIKTAQAQTTPTAEAQLESAFADPAEGDVFRLQKLIRTLGPVTQSEISEFLV
jgi:hypothetical protein